MTGATHSVCIVADDLTGTMDTSHGFAARGYGTAVVAVPPGQPGRLDRRPNSPILGVNTDTRYDDAAAAADVVAEVVRTVPAETVYKKVDSTLRGNVGIETDAALTASEADLALVAPAFPAAGRTTRDGIHYVDGMPLDETEYADDQKGPTSSKLTDIFESDDRAVEQISIDVVESGRDQVTAALTAAVQRHDRPPVVVCDAQTVENLATIADAGADHETLYVGSGGLAEHVAVKGAADGTSRSPAAVGPGSPLAVVGSVSATTLAQLEQVPTAAVIELKPVDLLTEPASEEGASRAADRLASGQPAVLTAATDRETVERTVREGEARGLGLDEISKRIASGLAATAAAVIDLQSPSGLFYTGGDVAVAGLRSLDATTVTLTGDAVTAGIPVGRLADGMASGTPIVTKAGGFGSEGAIVNCLGYLSGNNE
ncbi:four-carbon acid sugar kinase family protein [Haloarcula sp. S1AR25-5A]|uniref:Four-carbon acid sugar kinase family protein n=1 Tax=Haloarcula terrestris TaxID=2950533 RepID=A0AAE4JIF2_9EURY|nr:four-carbon acid sugar kinase family protein [Haloarcula terrestris]MDS0222470.1 four-carbon acid sugar kinase family protein [Haloarcula terrestris]